ncbi:MAG: hypothetical protein ACJ757_02755 [Gaiellaceae bacterium]
MKEFVDGLSDVDAAAVVAAMRDVRDQGLAAAAIREATFTRCVLTATTRHIASSLIETVSDELLFRQKPGFCPA